MNKIILLIITISLFSCKTNNKNNLTKENMQPTKNIYHFKVKDIQGNEFNFSTLKGKKIMIVNTASECGFTPQYKNLQSLYTKYKNDNFTIIGFPANNFGAQEPGTNKQIASFCTSKFNIDFPLMEKISVKGDDMHEIYKYLTSKKLNGYKDSEVKWNFQKYLINEKGFLVRVIYSKTLPDSQDIINWIENK